MFVGICMALSLLTVAHKVSELSLIVSLSVFKSCTVSCIKETVLGLQQVDVLSHLQNSEQAIWADEQLHIKFVRRMGCHCCSCC